MIEEDGSSSDKVGLRWLKWAPRWFELAVTGGMSDQIPGPAALTAIAAVISHLRQGSCWLTGLTTQKQKDNCCSNCLGVIKSNLFRTKACMKHTWGREMFFILRKWPANEENVAAGSFTSSIFANQEEKHNERVIICWYCTCGIRPTKGSTDVEYCFLSHFQLVIHLNYRYSSYCTENSFFYSCSKYRIGILKSCKEECCELLK